jgi:hypothetical protein
VRNLSIAQRASQTQFLVEATTFEIYSLWSQYHLEIKNLHVYPDGDGPTIGYLLDMPVCISRRWWSIDGELVLFWGANSQVVDYRMIDCWFDQQYSGKQVRRTDAQNFINILFHIQNNTMS